MSSIWCILNGALSSPRNDNEDDDNDNDGGDIDDAIMRNDLLPIQDEDCYNWKYDKRRTVLSWARGVVNNNTRQYCESIVRGNDREKSPNVLRIGNLERKIRYPEISDRLCRGNPAAVTDTSAIDESFTGIHRRRTIHRGRGGRR